MWLVFKRIGVYGQLTSVYLRHLLDNVSRLSRCMHRFPFVPTVAIICHLHVRLRSASLPSFPRTLIQAIAPAP